MAFRNKLHGSSSDSMGRHGIFTQISPCYTGSFSHIFSLLAASQIGSLQDDAVKIFAFLAAVSVALMTGFNVGEKSNSARNAWRNLNTSVTVTKYRNKQ